MPPTLVNVAVGLLIGVALLGAAFDRRSMAVVALAAALPDLDAALSLVIVGATNAMLHSLFIPLGAAAVLYWDTDRRERSWLRTRAGWYGVRVAWVAIAAYAVAGIGLDLFNVESVAVLYPVSNQYYAIIGHFVISSQEGLVQSYIGFGDGWFEVATRGTTATHHSVSWINPTPGTGNPADAVRRVRFVDSSWQLVLVLIAMVAVPAKQLIERGDR